MPNRLAAETSPYLLQHADNPVDWYPWGDEALSRARREDRPILLSIGYSACHWCHVMAHESFEDAATAAVMNRLFVNIKVDREERPDLDQIYQTAHQMLVQRPGGWPLTMFLTPAGRPFFGGTYFPRQARFGLPGFSGLLERVAEVFASRRADVEAQGQALVEALATAASAESALAERLDAAPIETAASELARHFDARHGGFGNAPKFPRPSDLAFLLRRHFRSGDPAALDMTLTTLRRMAEGGIYDQIGGGFCRYSVDAEWTIPHFEKMLYDNALLLGVYVDAWRITGEPLFARIVAATIGWVGREMTAPDGGFYSSLDADSEGEEGRFYVWRPEAVKALLDDDEWQLVAGHYGLDGPPNFENHAWHLRVAQPLDELAAVLSIAPELARRRLDAARAKLMQARQQRVRPGLDDKCLTSWNALMIGALARAARAFARPDWLAMARHARNFIEQQHFRDGRLLATSKDGRAHLNAYLDDYAFLLDALLELMQAEFLAADLDFARRLGSALIEHFVDADSGAFLFTSHDHEALIERPRSVHDNAIPAGSAVAVLALTRLAGVSGDESFAAAAARALRTQLGRLGGWPAGAASLLIALDEALAGGRLVVIRGPASQVREWLAASGARYAPDTVIIGVASGTGELPPPLAVKPAQLGDDETAAWICADGVCRPPERSLENLLAVIANAR